MIGAGYAVDAFGKVMTQGGAISSQIGYMYSIPYETEQEILNTPTDKPELMVLILARRSFQLMAAAFIACRRLTRLAII